MRIRLEAHLPRIVGGLEPIGRYMQQRVEASVGILTSLVSITQLSGCSFLPAVVCQILAEGQFAVDMILASLRILDSKVPVLVNKALRLCVELLQCRIGPPLDRKCTKASH